ncbi:MAG: hypothetical protein IIV93_04720, partial [Clostridia bacterium]|nr:hypothetical protein [Clostridia bacterium]
VHHQTGIQTYEYENLWDVANINYAIYENREELISMFGSEEEVPEHALELIKRGTVIEIMDDNCGYEFHLESELDKESRAIDFLGLDLSQLIVIESKEDAEYYATKYKGHEWLKVQIAAQNILEKMLEEEKRK